MGGRVWGCQWEMGDKVMKTDRGWSDQGEDISEREGIVRAAVLECDLRSMTVKKVRRAVQ
jgi:hypothetical protein